MRLLVYNILNSLFLTVCSVKIFTWASCFQISSNQHYYYYYLLSYLHGALGSVVVKALRYYSDGPGINPRCCHWIFQ
jgi:hypothetical protein